MKIIIFVIMILFVCSCETTKTTDNVSNKLIIGQWKTTKRPKKDYARIEFSTTGAVFYAEALKFTKKKASVRTRYSLLVES